ncbi:MAG: ATP-dependent Lon protease [Succiniclasticum sp.]
MVNTEEKLRQFFDEMVVYKDLKKQSNIFSALSLPSFMRDWILQKFEDEQGVFDVTRVLEFVQKYLPKKEDWMAIKNRIVVDREHVRFLAKISVDIDIKSGQVSFSLPDFGLTNKDTMIDEEVWDECKEDLLHGYETWGLVELGYQSPNECRTSWGGSTNGFYNKNKGENKGKVILLSFKPFCPYKIDLTYFKNIRNEFTVDEWIDVLLGAVDYNAAGYKGNKESKLTMLTRLLPFVEKRLNLIELAPKGTGKSYLFGRVSKYGWLSSGGTMSRAKMFYDQNRHMEGLVAGNDFITLDEVQTISFKDVDEMRAALKGYLESGIYTVGNHEGTAYAGVILCGNISQSVMEDDGFSNMFEELPKVFHESALIERFHGFIKGWNIPRMNDDLKASGWALNSEYFCSIMHELRDDMSYRAIVDDLVYVPDGADTRDTEAIKRICTAYLKLLFPNVRSASDISADDFERFCLGRARIMRDTIKFQLGLLDEEYKGKDIPALTVRGEYSAN